MPPTSSPRSITMKSLEPRCFSRMAMPSPAKPAPTMATSWTWVPSTRGTLAEPYLAPVADSNIDVVQRLFDDYAEGGVEAILEGADESIVIEIPPELSAEPDTYHGHDGVRRYFAGLRRDARGRPVRGARPHGSAATS